MKFTFNMPYDHDFSVNIGDVFYALDTETQVFKGFCPVCKGENRLTINSITFECPVCRKGSEKICKINHYTVRAYKVTSISLKNNSATWKTDMNENSYLIELSPHKKRGEYNLQGIRKVILKELRYEAEKDMPISKNPYYYRQNLFKDYRSLIDIANTENEKEEAELEKFNKDEHTDHTLRPWKTSHDSKQPASTKGTDHVNN